MSEKSPVKIDTAIIDTLKSLKKKWKLSNISEVIDKLMKDRKNLEDRIKTIEDRLQTSGQPQPAPTIIAPLTEVPKASSEVTEPPALIEPVKVGGQQCDFYTFNDKKQLVECMRKFAEKNEVSRVTQEVCDKCWNNIQSKKEQSKDQSSSASNSPSPEQNPSSANEKWTSAQQRAIDLAYEKTKAKEQAKAESKIAVLEAKRKLLETQNRLKEEDRKRREFHRNANRQSSIDMGDSAGIPEELVFRND
jgi:hypothetical protein